MYKDGGVLAYVLCSVKKADIAEAAPLPSSIIYDSVMCMLANVAWQFICYSPLQPHNMKGLVKQSYTCTNANSHSLANREPFSAGGLNRDSLYPFYLTVT